MATKNNIIIENGVKLVERVKDGRDLKEGELVFWKDSICEFMGAHDGGLWVVLKMKGGDLVRVNIEDGEVGRTDEKKKRLPDWLRRGVTITDERDGESYVIEKVGNRCVYLHGAGDVQVASIMLHYYESCSQPKVAGYVKVGAICRHEGRRAEVLDVQGYMAKVRIDYGCDVTCELDVYCGELRPDYDESERGMSSEEIEQRENDIYFRVYRGGVRIGKHDRFSRSEQQELEEMSCRSQINSCLLYGPRGFYDEDTDTIGRYGEDYVKSLGRDRVLQLWKAQKERFSHAKTHFAGYDSEGGGYYGIEWDAA